MSGRSTGWLVQLAQRRRQEHAEAQQRRHLVGKYLAAELPRQANQLTGNFSHRGAGRC
jgi:hypothetical protein